MGSEEFSLFRFVFVFAFSFFLFAFFVCLRFFLRFSDILLEDTANDCKFLQNGEFHSGPVCTYPVQNFPTKALPQVQGDEI